MSIEAYISPFLCLVDRKLVDKHKKGADISFNEQESDADIERETEHPR